MVALVSTIASPFFLPLLFSQYVKPLLRLSKEVTKKHSSIHLATSTVRLPLPKTAL
jgi:hypothetical protein